MIFDEQELFSKAHNLTASGASQNVLSYSPDSNIGIGEPLIVVIVPTAAVVGNDGNETYVADLQTDDLDTFGSPVVIGTVTIPRLSAAGTIFTIDLPPTLTSEAFLRLQFTLGGTTPSITYTAGLVWRKFVQAFTSYANNYTP
jgi:hypothetical protein